MTPDIPGDFEQFKGSGDIPGFQPRDVDRRDPFRDPRGYLAGPALVRAVNVALVLKMPLLVTGEPGTGKTELAYRIAAELLKTDEVLRFDTKSSSLATDLFYQFDSVRHFGRSQLMALRQQEIPPAHESIRLQPMGHAIVRTLDPAEAKRRLGFDVGHAKPRASVVLIDEVDKAPRDFPNDLLNQIENREFAIPELGGEAPFRADPEYAPVVVITSNSEKQLPEAFLRRCVYHHIEFPDDKEELIRILGGRLGGLRIEGRALGELLNWFLKLRREVELTKKPSTSELLDWLRALARAGLKAKEGIDGQRDVLVTCLGALVKTREDLERATGLVKDSKTLSGD